MLQINHLYKNYGKFQAVNDLNLHIEKGDLFGFVGPNGAGKTTTIRMVCGLMPPTSGSIQINGIDALSNPKEIKKAAIATTVFLFISAHFLSSHIKFTVLS